MNFGKPPFYSSYFGFSLHTFGFYQLGWSFLSLCAWITPLFFRVPVSPACFGYSLPSHIKLVITGLFTVSMGEQSVCVSSLISRFLSLSDRQPVSQVHQPSSLKLLHEAVSLFYEMILAQLKTIPSLRDTCHSFKSQFFQRF